MELIGISLRRGTTEMSKPFGIVLVLGFGIDFGIVYVIFGGLDFVLELSWHSL